MSTVLERPTARTYLRALPLRCALCHNEQEAAASAVCENCLGPLEPIYPDRLLPSREEIAARAKSLWRYREWLPFEGTPRYSLDTGFTPLIDAPRLAEALGVARAWVKNDSVSHPTLSFKDRVVTTALNAASALGIEIVGCASTGNLANAVAAHAARAGLEAWIFIPESLEHAKIAMTSIYGPKLVRVRGNYDDVNRLCTQIADRYGWGIVNVNLRTYYGEGSKTVAFEICEQLGWRFPDAVIAPMAGGALVTRLEKGFREFDEANLVDGRRPRIYGAQANGCAPIVNLVQSGGETLEPVRPDTIAKSLSIGNPADGYFARNAIKNTGGWAAKVSDDELRHGIRLLAETTGLFTETAGGVTVAGALQLARTGKLRKTDEVVLCITGNGLKTLDALDLPESPVIDPKIKEFTGLVNSTSISNSTSTSN